MDGDKERWEMVEEAISGRASGAAAGAAHRTAKGAGIESLHRFLFGVGQERKKFGEITHARHGAGLENRAKLSTENTR